MFRVVMLMVGMIHYYQYSVYITQVMSHTADLAPCTLSCFVDVC